MPQWYTVYSLPVMFMLVWLSIFNQSKHFLVMLLLFEVLTLLLVLGLSVVCYGSAYSNMYVLLPVLVLGAAEGAVGLALLVVMTRQTGNNMLASLTNSKC